MVRENQGRVRYVDENFGNSELAKAFGVKDYPAIFVDQALVARPQDFYGWDKERGGRYHPWVKNPENQQRFQDDLRRMVAARLRGEELESVSIDPNLGPLARLPALELTTLDGETIRTADLADQIVVLEIWASWCPPCLSTLGWLQEISERQDAPITVLAVAVESDEEQVREVVRKDSLTYPVVVADEALAEALGNVLAVPTLHVFDPSGQNVGVFYGAPADLHQRIGALLNSVARP